jgi:hypothetical protein
MSETQSTITRTAPPDYATATATRPQDEAEIVENATAWIPNLPTTQTARYTRLEVSISGLQVFMKFETDGNRNRSSSQG